MVMRWMSGMLFAVYFHFAFVSYWSDFNSEIEGPRLAAWALVTGGTRGIGNAYCRELASRGFNVAVVGSSRESAVAAAERLQADYPDVKFKAMGESLSRPSDYVDAIETEMSDEIKKQAIQVVVLNAGVEKLQQLLVDMPNDEVESLLLSNIVTQTLLSKAAVSWMNNEHGGIIIGESAISSFWTMLGAVPYCATRSYQSRFWYSLNDELRLMKSNVTSTVVDVEVVLTDALLSYLEEIESENIPQVKAWGWTPDEFVGQAVTRAFKGERYITVGWIWRTLRFLHVRLGLELPPHDPWAKKSMTVFLGL